MSKSLNSLTLFKRWNHHTDSGGYDKLANYLSEKRIFTNKKPKKKDTILQKAWRRLPSSKYVNHYEFGDLFSELKTFARVPMERVDLVHSLYAEDQLNFLLRFKDRLKCALVGSYHLPVESSYVQKAVANGHYRNLKKLDAAIVVSSSMIKEFENWVGKDKVFFVPHGIDTQKFSPGTFRKATSDTFNILSVGQHGRDWGTIEEVLKNTMQGNSKINFNIVFPGWSKKDFKDLKKVNIYSDIPESKLIELYQKADILLLPIHYGSANNSVLESLACGTPVISTKTGGMPDYIDEGSGWLFEREDTSGIITLLNSMLDNHIIYQSKRDSARKKALTFDWIKVAESVREVYKIAYDRWRVNLKN